MAASVVSPLIVFGGGVGIFGWKVSSACASIVEDALAATNILLLIGMVG